MNELAFTLTQKPVHELTYQESDYLLCNFEEQLTYEQFRDISDHRDYLEDLND
jgi:hypothetical protein